MLTIERVVALAPDAASLSAGRSLATAAQWSLLGIDAVLLWGDCRGSGSAPYRITIDHATTEYACTCPSRKLPCKHVIALLLLAAAGAVPKAQPPERALAWFVARERKREATTGRARAATPAPEDDAARAVAAERRARSRDAKVAAGLDEMERWLFDIARLGIASVQREPASFWHAKAARLVDAQAPGLARRVRDLAETVASGRDVPARAFATLGSLYALREAFARLETLTGDRRSDVRRQIGYTQREDEAVLRPGSIVADRWTVIGSRTDEDERLVAHRAWLYGERTQRFALVLQFVVPGGATTPLATAVPAGAAFEGRLAYYEGSVPQRVVVVERGATENGAPPEGETIAALLDAYAADLARDPWHTVSAARLAVRHVARNGDTWLAADASGSALPMARTGYDPFVVRALCGNRPMTLYAEWNGTALQPLAVLAGGRFVRVA